MKSWPVMLLIPYKGQFMMHQLVYLLPYHLLRFGNHDPSLATDHRMKEHPSVDSNNDRRHNT
jgi:hypothetical protein